MNLDNEKSKQKVCESCGHQPSRFKKYSKSEGEMSAEWDTFPNPWSDEELSPAAIRSFFGVSSCSESLLGEESSTESLNYHKIPSKQQLKASAKHQSKVLSRHQSEVPSSHKSEMSSRHQSKVLSRECDDSSKHWSHETSRHQLEVMETNRSGSAVVEQSCLRPSLAKALFMQLDSEPCELGWVRGHSSCTEAAPSDTLQQPNNVVTAQNNCHCLACCLCAPKERLSGACPLYVRRSLSTNSLDRGLSDLECCALCEPVQKRPSTLPKGNRYMQKSTELPTNSPKDLKYKTETASSTSVGNSPKVHRQKLPQESIHFTFDENGRNVHDGGDVVDTEVTECHDMCWCDKSENKMDFSRTQLHIHQSGCCDMQSSKYIGHDTPSKVTEVVQCELPQSQPEVAHCVVTQSDITQSKASQTDIALSEGAMIELTHPKRLQFDLYQYKIAPSELTLFKNARSQWTKSVNTKSELNQSKTAQPELTNSKTTQSELSQTKSVKSELIQYKMAKSELIQSKTAGSELAQSKTVQSELNKSKREQCMLIQSKKAHSELTQLQVPVITCKLHRNSECQCVLSVVKELQTGDSHSLDASAKSQLASKQDLSAKLQPVNQQYVSANLHPDSKQDMSAKLQPGSKQDVSAKLQPISLEDMSVKYQPESKQDMLTKKYNPPCSPSRFKEKADDIETFFSGLSDDQKNTLLQRLLGHSDVVQKHFLCEALGTDSHPGCPPNCQDRIAWLPETLVLHIFSYLDPVSLCRAARVCRVWRLLVSDHSIWRRFCRLPKWKLSRSGEQKQIAQHLTPEGEVQWKEVFAERFHLRENWLRGRCTVRTFEGHMQGISCVQFDDTRIVSGSSDKTIKVWNIRTNSPWSVQTLVGHSGTVRCLHLEGNRLVSGSTDRTIKVWDLSTQHSWSSIACKLTMVGHTDTVRCLQVDDDKVISGSYDQTLKLWSMRTGRCRQTLVGHEAAVLCVHFNQTKIVSGSCDKTIKVWNFEGRCMMTLRGHQDAVTCLQFDSQRIVSGSLDCNLKFWDIHTGQCKNTIDWKDSEGHTGVVRCLQADSWRVVSASDDRTLKVWSLETGQRLVTLRNHSDGVTCLQFNDSLIVSGSYDKTVRLWDFSSV